MTAPTIAPDFREFIAALDAEGSRYLVIGGYAVGFHGRPRYTKDIDIWVDNSHENAERTAAAIHRFGFGSLGLTAEDFAASDEIVQLGFPPVRIDILSAVPGVDFEESYGRRILVDVDGLAVSVIGRNDLIASKKAAGRGVDLGDVASLEEPDR